MTDKGSSSVLSRTQSPARKILFDAPPPFSPDWLINIDTQPSPLACPPFGFLFLCSPPRHLSPFLWWRSMSAALALWPPRAALHDTGRAETEQITWLEAIILRFFAAESYWGALIPISGIRTNTEVENSTWMCLWSQCLGWLSILCRPLGNTLLLHFHCASIWAKPKSLNGKLLMLKIKFLQFHGLVFYWHGGTSQKCNGSTSITKI